MTTLSYLVADEPLRNLHMDAWKVLIRLNETAEATYQAGRGRPLLHGAMLSMTGDMLCLHRSVWCLCDGGWAFATPVLLRTMMDLLISCLALASPEEDREFRSFRYMYSFQKEGIASPHAPASAKEAARADIVKAIQQMSVHDRDRAQSFLKAKAGAYWYKPEYSNPSDVLDKKGTKDLKSLYASLSSAAHAGFAGLREFRDEPWIIDSAPREDKVSQNRALALSTRILLEFAALRANLEEPAAVRSCLELIVALADVSTRSQVVPNLADL